MFRKREDMKKIIIIGCPGSGKSTFARALHKKIGIPLYYLDIMYWNADKTVVEKSLFLERLSDVMKNDEWIIDGNYSSTMEMRMDACDTAIFLDYPPHVCLDGAKARVGKKRDDMPWIEDGEDEEFLGFIKSFNREQRPKIFSLIDKYSDKNILIFKNREEAAEFIRNI